MDPRHSPGKMMQAHRLLSCLTETVCYYHGSSREHCFAVQELFCLSQYSPMSEHKQKSWASDNHPLNSFVFSALGSSLSRITKLLLEV